MVDLTTRNPQMRRYSSLLGEVTGYGKDLMRSYADFMQHDSNNLAKLASYPKLREALRSIQYDRRDAALIGDYERHDELSQLYNAADGYVKHFMYPAQDFVKIRSLIVVKQLWGNIKTALANINSLVQTLAVATTDQGLIKGTYTTGRTTFGQVKEGIDRVYAAVRKSGRGDYSNFSPDEREAMLWAQQKGVIDETFAAQLAVAGSSSTLSRLNYTGNKMLKDLTWWGMYPQHMMENFTRRVSFLTAYRTYRSTGMPVNQARVSALKKTLLLQGDNSLVNRPEFMRGKAAMVTIYFGFTQNMLWLTSGGYERGRIKRIKEGLEPAGPRDKLAFTTTKMWLGYLMMSGLMGLPGAEDLDAVLEIIAKLLFGKRFSLKEHAYKMADTIAERAHEFGIDLLPRTVVHGLTSNFNMFGTLPSMDLSSSMGLGQVVPGAGGLSDLGVAGKEAKFLLGALGPLGKEIDNGMKLFGDDPSFLRRYALFIPAGVSNFVKMWSDKEAGALYPSGAKVIRDPVTNELRDRTTGEKIAQLMGFSPSQVTAAKELHYTQKERADYWIGQRNQYLTQYWEARLSKDREAIADAMHNIADYNKEAPVTMRLLPADLSRSVQARMTRMRADEAGMPVSKRARSIYQDVAKDFTVNGGE